MQTVRVSHVENARVTGQAQWPTDHHVDPTRMSVPSWWVATRDDSGEMGPYGDLRGFILRPAPESPVAEEPEIQENTIVLRWSAGVPGQQYRFQLSRDWRFETLLVNSTLTEPQITLPRLESGFYYLRIKTIDVDGYAGPFGPGQRIQIQPAIYWPFIVAPIIVMLLLL